VDVVARTEEDFLTCHAMRKGAMTLIDAAAAERLYYAMPPGEESSGGSNANTCAVAAALGARVAYLGKVADDPLGGVFRRDMTATGVHFPSVPLRNGAPTARCLILVTPDGHRTMNTFLGAAVAFAEEDVDTALIADAAVLYLEGYLFDPPAAQTAFRRAAAAAHAAGRKVALTLSDPFCVDRHRDAFRALVRGGVDVLFANEAEVTSLYQVNSFADAVEAVRAEVELAALTRSESGSVVVRGAETVTVARGGLSRVPRTSGVSQPWSTALMTRCLSASATPSSTFLSSSTSSPTRIRRTSLPVELATSRISRGNAATTRRTGTIASPIAPSRTSASRPRESSTSSRSWCPDDCIWSVTDMTW